MTTRRLAAALLALCLAAQAQAATRTSTQAGNTHTAPLAFGVIPSSGDILVVGHAVNIDGDLTLGSTTAAGHAVTINSGGTLSGGSGFTLALAGADTTTNTLMLVNSGGSFTPTGLNITGDTPGDYGSIILNKGRVALTNCSLSVPSANIDWTTAVASEAVGNQAIPYDYAGNIRVAGLANPWVANSGGTGLGSLADTSLSISGQSTAGTLTTEVASIAAVNGAGKYYVNYDQGVIYFYSTNGTNTFTAAYKRLNLAKTWGIDSSQNAAGNSFVSTGCTYQFMGPITGAQTKNAIYAENKKSAAANSGGTDRIFEFTGNTVRYCSSFLGIRLSTGTLADPIPVTGNTIYHVKTPTSFGGFFNQQGGGNDYLSLSGNTLSMRGVFAKVAATATGTTPITSTGLKIDGNTGTCGGLFTGPSLGGVYPGGSASNNSTVGLAGVDDLRWIVGFGGTQASPTTIAGNSIGHANRLGNWTSHSVIEKNLCYRTYHHGWIAPVEDDLQIQNVVLRNNLYFGNFADASSASPFIEFGYNHRQWLDDVRAVNNTVVDHPQGVFGFGDCQDSGTMTTLVTKAVVANNLVYNSASGGTAGGQAAIQRSVDLTARVTRIHCVRLDNNLGYNVTAFYEATQACKGGTFTLAGANYSDPGTTRNVTGVALQFPSYSTSQSGITLAYTHTSATDRKLTLTDSGGAGSAVQLVYGSGTLTSAGAHATQGASSFRSGATLTDSGQAWNTTKSNAACPAGRWLLMTSGAAAGEVRAITNNTATALTVVPAFATLPASGDTFVILNPEVTLTAGSGATVNAGIDARVLPSSTVSDSSISYARSDVTTDPLLSNAAGTAATDFAITSSSPAKDAGVTVSSVTTDYSGTARPQGSAYDLGAFELVPAASGSPRQPRMGIGIGIGIGALSPPRERDALPSKRPRRHTLASLAP